MPISKQVLAVTLSSLLVFMPFMTQAPKTYGAAAAEPQNVSTPNAPATTSHAQPSPKELQSLVAPIALYPDKLVAQILAGATHPTQIVEAERWMGQHKDLHGEELANAVNKEPWDPSIKGLTQFPDVLSGMNKNLSWTSALGDTYHNEPNEVMAAIQTLRKEAEQAGHLKSTSQQTVSTQGSTIVIQPADPQVVYVPTYSPAIYGAVPPPVYPGYSGWDMAAASALSFGAGMAVGAAFDHPWGWGAWDTNWHGGTVNYNHNTYISNTNTFSNRTTNYSQYRSASDINRSAYNTQNLDRSMSQWKAPSDFPSADRYKGSYSGAESHNWQSAAESRGFSGDDRSMSGMHSGSFSGFGDGGFAHDDSFRGQSSFGGFDRGGGGFGGGGFHGGRRD